MKTVVSSPKNVTMRSKKSHNTVPSTKKVSLPIVKQEDLFVVHEGRERKSK